MAVGNVGREYPAELVHQISKSFTFSEATSGTVITVGTLPPCVVIDAFVAVTTAFNSGTSAVLDVGVSGDVDGLMSAVDMTTAGVIKDTALAATDDHVFTSAAAVQCDAAISGATTAGAATVVVTYIPTNHTQTA